MSDGPYEGGAKYPGPFICDVDAALSVIGGKWKMLIVWDLLERTLRHGELRRAFPGITQKVLTQQLRELEADGIIHREVFREVPPKVEYSLTEFGLSLKPLVCEADRWGKANAEGVLERRAASRPAT